VLPVAYEPPDVTWPLPELDDGAPVLLRPPLEEPEPLPELVLPELALPELVPLELLLPLPELELDLPELLVPELLVPDRLDADPLAWSRTDAAFAEPGSV
jgi:hypothetical protein